MSANKAAMRKARNDRFNLISDAIQRLDIAMTFMKELRSMIIIHDQKIHRNKTTTNKYNPIAFDGYKTEIIEHIAAVIKQGNFVVTMVTPVEETCHLPKETITTINNRVNDVMAELREQVEDSNTQGHTNLEMFDDVYKDFIKLHDNLTNCRSPPRHGGRRKRTHRARSHRKHKHTRRNRRRTHRR